ncbi:MAG: exo-alpha-sialidase, partial [Armatimonadetes bacterium]|nr:exo-alpha-sialidase [Armatimonadota bacterium]
FCAFVVELKSIRIAGTKDAGKTWSKPVEVMKCPRDGYIADPNVLSAGKRLTVYATFVPAPWPPFSKSETYASTSEDGGATWSSATRITMPHKYTSGKVHVPLRLKDGTLVMGYSWDIPAEEGHAAGEEGTMNARAGVLLSHDEGKTWAPGGDVHVAESPMGADEPALVQLKNGDLFMIARTSTSRPYETRSHDGGLTWEDPKPSRFQGFNSPSCLLRLKDKSVLRVWDNSASNRFPLVASLSTDECKTWSPPRTLTEPTADAKGELSFRTACYPSAAQAKDGTIVVVWWETSAAGSNIGLARFNRAWVEEAKGRPKPGTIVAFGDSVTLGARPGVTEYQTFRHLLEGRLKEKGVNARVVNAGVGGSNTRDALARMERDVLAEDPQLVIVTFGVNDAAMIDGGPVARTEPRVLLDEYRANLNEILLRCRQAKAKVLLCTPTPMTRAYPYSNMGEYSQAKHEDINYMLRRYAEAARQVARQQKIPLVDLFDLFTTRPEGLSLIPDGNHPWPEGHALIAEALFEVVRKALQ